MITCSSQVTPFLRPTAFKFTNSNNRSHVKLQVEGTSYLFILQCLIVPSVNRYTPTHPPTSHQLEDGVLLTMNIHSPKFPGISFITLLQQDGQPAFSYNCMESQTRQQIPFLPMPDSTMAFMVADLIPVRVEKEGEFVCIIINSNFVPIDFNEPEPEKSYVRPVL